MENKALFPLIRNKYFFGKLLTKRDMEAEQSYFNNKRRLLNALMYGSGVVCGLRTIEVDDFTIAVESGLALDGLGRELALDKPVIVRLSELEGFERDRGKAPYVYLCAEYAETPREPLHAMTDSALDENHYGLAEEGIHLYLRYGEPEAAEVEATRPGSFPPDAWRDEALDKKLLRGEQVRIYLARIHLVRCDEAYEIGRIEPVPFRQYASVTPEAEPNVPPPPQPAEPAVVKPQETEQRHAFGTAVVDIPEGARFGSLHFSEEISHGLGLSGVSVTLGLQTGGGTVFGDNSIFFPEEYDWAVKTSDESGTFKIGVRVKTNRPDRHLRFSWMAVSASREPEALTKPQIVISPNLKRLCFRQSLQFSAELRGLPKTDILWSVREQDGGSITRDGLYIAPNTEGVFTIIAASAANPDITGINFVIVGSE